MLGNFSVSKENCVHGYGREGEKHAKRYDAATR